MDASFVGLIFVGFMISFGLWGIEKELINIRRELKHMTANFDGVEWQLMLMNDENAEWEEHGD